MYACVKIYVCTNLFEEVLICTSVRCHINKRYSSFISQDVWITSSTRFAISQLVAQSFVLSRRFNCCRFWGCLRVIAGGLDRQSEKCTHECIFRYRDICTYVCMCVQIQMQQGIHREKIQRYAKPRHAKRIESQAKQNKTNKMGKMGDGWGENPGEGPAKWTENIKMANGKCLARNYKEARGRDIGGFSAEKVNELLCPYPLFFPPISTEQITIEMRRARFVFSSLFFYFFLFWPNEMQLPLREEPFTRSTINKASKMWTAVTHKLVAIASLNTLIKWW